MKTMKNMALELWLKGQDRKSDTDVKCIVMITFLLDKDSHKKCSKCEKKISGINIRLNDVEVEYNRGWISKEKIENRVKNVIRKIEGKLEPNCLSDACSTSFYNDFSSHVHKRGHRILDRL